MTEAALELLAGYGLPFLGLVVAAGCLGIPVPSSLAILFAGALAAGGEFAAWQVFTVCLTCAIAGDQTGYAIGRLGVRTLAGNSTLDEQGVVATARSFLSRRGNWAVFFSRWLVAPLGPPINLLAGAALMPWRRYTLFEVAGEIVWVVLYMGLGMVFSLYITQIAELAADLSGFLAAGLVAFVMGKRLVRVWRTPRVGG